MRFELTDDQRAFAQALDGLVAGSDPVGVARAWADGDAAPGLKLWSRLAEQGVNALLVPEEDGGMGATPVELVVAFEVLGRHAVPGPWVESAAYLATALDGEARQAVAEGQVATVAVPPHTSYALDADVAEAVFVAGGLDTPSLVPRGGCSTDLVRSVDRTRRLFGLSTAGLDTPSPSGSGYSTDLPEGGRVAAEERGGVSEPFDLAALATSAQLLGLGERVLADSVGYAKQRRQFGREVGSYQAVKHALADVRIALDFARPLIHGAALDSSPRSVSAAKVQAGDAAYLAARTGLQVHGALGYTQEFDLSIWLTKIRALVTAWGTPAFHRARVLDSLTKDR